MLTSIAESKPGRASVPHHAHSWRGLPFPAKTFISLIVVVGIATLVYGAIHQSSKNIAEFICYLGIAILASRERTHLPLGTHGAILPFVLAPGGFILGRCLGFLKATGNGFTYFGMAQVHYVHVAVIFTFVLIVYYLVWKYLIGFFNRVEGIAD